AQSELAKNAGIEGFMYWHYWFGNGKTLLQRPFQEVLKSGKPDFPFCLGWANHNWENKTWHTKDQYKKTRILVEQLYLGKVDYENHFYYLLGAFKDKRYITVEGKPIFFIYSPPDFHDIGTFIDVWQHLAKQNGLKGIYFIGQANLNSECNQFLKTEIDGVCRAGVYEAQFKIRGEYVVKALNRLRRLTHLAPLQKYNYSDIIKNLLVPELDKIENVYPTVIPNYDHSPRSGGRGAIWYNSTPELFQKLLHKAIESVQHKDDEHKIVFLRSWNEWAEGNYVEPDLKYGHGYLDALKQEVLYKNESEKQKV
ncbi:MAG: glycoside hydrolase family 99-like domain-containing protein, partial [Chitinophagaceae bacterium]|nr:glycoside hydrolase family 99-like domain-containing protein [Chitinophagaceae bacterium]